MGKSPNRQKDVFLAALDLPSPDARAAFLAQACEGDDALRQRVEAMLKAHGEPDSFLENPAAMLDQTVDRSSDAVTAAPVPCQGPGTRIGAYKLVEQIGEGGMGVVYMAQQLEPIHRMVALKIIKPGMDSGQVLARFEAERQALAVMDHPNIARVLDAGATADGRPFFVMELVKGTPITEFCDQRRLSPRERLELFVTVCQAIQHAHQKGVIHRDIKPSNVLVALYDDKPVPKVIDFGVAKAAGQPLTARTLHTGFGAIVGTPQYMIPEQATFNQLDIDTRSDVYSLGVLLYELLAGTTPVDKARFREAAVLEVLRVVREEEPPRPSVKLSTTAARAGIAATRGTDSDKLAQLLRGELDWIVMKALEKDRHRRYETAAGLARDVDRYLNDELVEARPPSTGYRLRKFVKRNRGKVMAALFVLLALVGGVIGTTMGMLRAHDAEHRAIDAFRSAENNKMIAELHRDNALKALHEAEISEQHATAQALEANTARHGLLIAQAMRCWEDNRVGEATQYIDSVSPSFTATWEARFLRSRFRQKFSAFPLSEDESLAWLAPSPDGRWLVAWTNYAVRTGQPETLHLVDAGTGKTKFKFFAPAQGIAFSHDGKWVAVAGNSNDNGRPVVKTKTFDLGTGSERASLDDVAGSVFDVAVSPDDTRIALACLDRVVIRDGRDGKVRQTLAQTGEIRRLAFSADGKRLAAYSFARNNATAAVKTWDLEVGQETFSRQIDMQEHSLGLHTMDLSADGCQLALSFTYSAALNQQDQAKELLETVPETVELWDTTTGKTRWSVDTVKGQLVGVAFSPDGRHVACTGTDSVFVLNAGTGKLEKSFKAEGSHGYSGTPLYAAGLNYLPDGRHVVTSTGIWGLEDVTLETLALQDLSHGHASDPGAENGIMGAAAFSADGKRVLACAGTLLPDVGEVEELVSWNAEAGRQDLAVTRWKGYHVLSLSYSLSGKRLVLGCQDGHLAVCDTDTGKEMISITGPAGQPYQNVAINSDGSWIASSDHNRVILWDTVDGAKRQALAGHTGDVGRIAISGDGTLVAAAVSAFAAERSQVCIWDAATGRFLRTCALPGNQEVTCLGFSPDGRRLVAGYSGAGTLTMWNTQTGGIVQVLKGHTSRVASLAFSPDGHRLASGGFDQTVRLWDVETGQEVLAIKIPGRGQSVVFSSDGKRLAASIGYKSVLVWEAP